MVGGECVGDPFTCDDNNPQTVDVCVGDGCMFHFEGTVPAELAP
jgi:hypothetical protein